MKEYVSWPVIFVLYDTPSGGGWGCDVRWRTEYGIGARVNAWRIYVGLRG